MTSGYRKRRWATKRPDLGSRVLGGFACLRIACQRRGRRMHRYGEFTSDLRPVQLRHVANRCGAGRQIELYQRVGVGDVRVHDCSAAPNRVQRGSGDDGDAGSVTRLPTPPLRDPTATMVDPRMTSTFANSASDTLFEVRREFTRRVQPGRRNPRLPAGCAWLRGWSPADARRPDRDLVAIGRTEVGLQSRSSFAPSSARAAEPEIETASSMKAAASERIRVASTSS